MRRIAGVAAAWACAGLSLAMGARNYDAEVVLGEHIGTITNRTPGGVTDDRATVNDATSGVWSNGAVAATFDGGWHATGTAVGDVDNDGTNEVVVTYQYYGDDDALLAVYRYVGGTWTTAFTYQFRSGGWGVQGAAIANVNNSPDGSNELVLAWHWRGRKNHENDLVIVYRVTGTTLTELVRSDSWGGGWNMIGVGAGDMNNDGANEVLVAWTYYDYTTRVNGGDTLQILDFTGNTFSGVRWDGALRRDDGPPWDMTGIDIGDLDNDGVNEVAISWRKFAADGSEQGRRVTAYDYTGSLASGSLSAATTLLDDDTATWGIHGIGIGDADRRPVPPPPRPTRIILR